MHPSFLKPLYDWQCFSDIPQLVKHLLTGTGQVSLAPDVFGGTSRKYETIILFFVDAFGWRFFEQYQHRHPLLQALTSSGLALQLTSQFPSTTAAHLTTIHTGLAVGQSGVYEWQYYEPKLDALIAPLLFSYAGSKQREELKSKGIDPAGLFPTRTFYQDLADHGVKSFVFQHRDYTPTSYSQVAFQGAEVVPYKTLPEALVSLRIRLQGRRAPSYYFLYFDLIDTIGHVYGPTSPHIEAEIDSFLTTMERRFLRPLAGQLQDALMILTADHGLVEIDPHTTIYLNRDPRFVGVERYLKRNRAGELLVPAGSPRDLFLYVQDELLEEAQTFLAERLDGHADVVQVADLIAEGYFSLPVSSSFISRVGNLVILPYAGESVWWYEKDRFEQKFYGHHGGLTPQEMEIPLILYEFQA